MTNRCPENLWRINAGQFLDVVDGKNNGEGSYIREGVLYPKVLNHLGSVNGKKILDAGCGDGIIGRLAMKRGAKVFGCDIVEEFLQEARRRSNNEEQVVLADLRQPLPFTTDSFDRICLNLVLMWIPEIDGIIKETYRITKPGGKVVISLLHPWTALSKVDNSDPNQPLLILQNNIQDGIFMRTVNKTAGPYTYYQRSLANYVNAFTKEGFQMNPGDGIDEVAAPKNSKVSEARKLFPEFVILTFTKV